MTSTSGECVQDDPFRIVLHLATARVFDPAPDLGALLDNDPAGVIYRLSHDLKSFGTVRDGQPDSRLNHEHLLTAARAYVVARRKLKAHAIEQGVLPLSDADT